MKSTASELTFPESSKVKLDDILDIIRTYGSESDIDLVRKAYVFATKAHEGQKR